MTFAQYYYLEEGVKDKLKAIGLAGLATLGSAAYGAKPMVNFEPTNSHHETLPTPSKNVDVVAATLYKEARGEGVTGMEAVNEVINNRSKAKNKDLYTVCTQRKQFSCWNNITPTPDVIENIKTADPKLFGVAKKIASGELTNHTNGALFYHTLKVHPDWSDKLKKQGYKTVVVGNHIFYFRN